jgi:hypothetical protein
MLIYFMAIWNILWIIGIFYDRSVHFVFIGYIFSSFGIMHQEKSGNPGREYIPMYVLVKLPQDKSVVVLHRHHLMRQQPT